MRRWFSLFLTLALLLSLLPGTTLAVGEQPPAEDSPEDSFEVQPEATGRAAAGTAARACRSRGERGALASGSCLR